MNRDKNLHRIIIYVCISLICVICTDGQIIYGRDSNYEEVGGNAPDFSLRDFRGEEFNLADELENHKGILLWFTNLCRGCQARISRLEEINNLYKEKLVQLVAVSVLGEDRKTVEDVIEKEGITFRLLFDPKGEVTELFTGIYAPGACPLKNIFLINGDGKLLMSDHYPGMEESEIRNYLDKVIQGEEK